jgi:Flp pilus assembly protein TadG
MSIAALADALRRERGGSAAVEMALLVPILSLLLFAGIDLARGFSAKLDLEQAAGRTIELATASGTVKADYSFLKTEAMLASSQPTANVFVSNWLECNSNVNANFQGTCAVGEQTARYVSVRITKNYVPLFKWMGLVVSGVTGNSVIIQGDAVVRVQ